MKLRVEAPIVTCSHPDPDIISSSQSTLTVTSDSQHAPSSDEHQSISKELDSEGDCNKDEEEGDHNREDEEEEHNKEDEEAHIHQVQLSGLSYDSCLQTEDLEMGADDIFSVAPGEGKKPIGILTDKHFEEMCNPTKYPYGKFDLLTNREKKLTVRKYFNQRLLDADGRFAKVIEYLLTVQYAVESNQVADDASISCYDKPREDFTGNNC